MVAQRRNDARSRKRRTLAQKRRATPVLFPVAIDRSYVQFLLRRVRLAQEQLTDQLKPLFDEHAKEINQRAKQKRQDVSTEAARFLNAIGVVESGFNRRQIPNQRALTGKAKGVDKFATNQQKKQLELFVPPKFVARVGVSLSAPATATRKAWVKANVELIKSIDVKFFDDVKKIVGEGFEQGRSTRDIRKSIQEKFQVSRSRAKFIARDQIAKLNGDITKARQTAAGVTRYRWSTSGDDRVRDTHRAHNGKIFFWDKPPADTGHPGQDFQCRCIAEPVFDD